MAKKRTKVVETTEDEIDFTDLDEDSLPAMTREVDGVQLPDAWEQSLASMNQVSRHRQSFNMKHGMFSNTPMICKGSGCPLSNICDIPIRNRPVLNRCPIEIATIVELYDRYCEELHIGPKDYFDQSRVKDLVDIEVKLMRASGQLAFSADLIEEVVFATDPKGNAYSRPELHKATEYEERLLKEKAKIISDLNATRKQRERDKQVNEASTFASDLMSRAMAAQRAHGSVPFMNMMDVTVVDVEEVEEVQQPEPPQADDVHTGGN